jgi:serine protease AprX
VPNTDQTVGHGTHCAGIIGGSGIRSGGGYAGVAPGAKIVGAGLGAGLFVLNAIGAWEYGLANQYPLQHPRCFQFLRLGRTV